MAKLYTNCEGIYSSCSFAEDPSDPWSPWL